jgi:hypothetical protein
MKNDEIVDKLNDIHKQPYSYEYLDNELQTIKENYVTEANQEQAKLLWVYQRIVKIHRLYTEAFGLLKDRSYYPAWCILDRIELNISSLKKHFPFNKKDFYLWHVERSVKNLQVMFPYKLFMSMEILKKKKECSICGKEVSVRNFCGHEVGEIYNGEMCYRLVTESEMLGISMVENPGNKYSVAFIQNERGEQEDGYNYDIIDYLFEHIESPYEFWDLEVSTRVLTKNDLGGNAGRNDFCPCNSGKKFKKCCLSRVGEKYPHYGFILVNPSDKALLSSTIIIR